MSDEIKKPKLSNHINLFVDDDTYEYLKNFSTISEGVRYLLKLAIDRLDKEAEK